MKILVSAYACDPNKGSEPGIGWHWAIEIARRGHRVWILTRANNRSSIEPALERIPEQDRPQILYYDLPGWAGWWKGSGLSVYPYYLLWQWGAARRAKIAHQTIGFDLVHHVTFGNLRTPSFMGRLGTRLIVGPAGGGERAPWRLMTGIGSRGLASELARTSLIFLARFNPLTRAMIRRADRIIATSRQSSRLIPESENGKLSMALAIGVDPGMLDVSIGASNRIPGASPRILYVGRMLAWKGMDLGLSAFANFAASYYGASLTLVGAGPARARWTRLASRLGVADRISWLPWSSRRDLRHLYTTHDALIFPSLHDSGGMVVLEALAHGLPVVCLDIGGPGQIVNESCGHVVASRDRTRDEVISDLEKGLVAVTAIPDSAVGLRDAAKVRARAFRWDRQVAKVYRSIEADFTSETHPCDVTNR